MTKDDVLFGYRQVLFAEASPTTVAGACRRFGVHRLTYLRLGSARSTAAAWRCCIPESGGVRRCPTSRQR
jgi:hypothetical protein